ncbi:ATP-binding cassette domain-containing protein, partial [Streptomyces sp. NPDC001478]
PGVRATARPPVPAYAYRLPARRTRPVRRVFGETLDGELSGGQQQRVAVARALITDPDVIFADEPTGALDTVTAAEVLGLLRQAVDGLGATVVMVTHDPAAAAWADRVLFLADGVLAGSLDRAPAERIAARMAALTPRPGPLAGVAA